jgi:hypothetical protein
MFVRMTGQGPRSSRGRAAAVGETILSGEGFIPSPAKWWGPAVLEAGCGRTSCWAFREPAPLPSRYCTERQLLIECGAETIEPASCARSSAHRWRSGSRKR